MKILWLTNIPSPYRVDFFNELGKLCDLTVLFERKSSDERDISWNNFSTENFKAIFLKGKNIGSAEAFCPSVITFLDRKYDHIVITNFSDPTGIFAILALRIKGIPYELESDGAFPGIGTGAKESIKRYFIAGAERYFSTAKLNDQYYVLYGAKEDRIIRYPFTSLFDRDVLSEPVSLDKKLALRNKLGITEKKIVLAVGQFITRKGFDILIKSSVYLDDSYGFYIVGGKPTQEYMDMTCGKKNIHFVGFKETYELKHYYQAADVFVHPTREDIWGLVINEAMANALPVVTTERCVAGLEMIEQGETGYIVPVEDEISLALAIKKCLQFKDKSKILEKARQYTLEKMAIRHIAVWKDLSKGS